MKMIDGSEIQNGIYAMNDHQQSRAKLVGSKIRRVTKVSICEEIAQQLMDLISNGDLKPGKRLPAERDLCKEFGAGRSSLREALRCLSIVGVLDARVGEGTSVAVDGGKFLGKIIEWRLITEKHDIANLLEVRSALEGVAAANVALLGKREDIDKLEKLIAHMKASVDNTNEFAVLDLEFHLTLAKASGNSLLFDLISMIRSQLVRALSKVLLLPRSVPLSLKERTAILRAIKRGDSDMAREAMHAHLYAALLRYNETAIDRIIPHARSVRKTRCVKAQPNKLLTQSKPTPKKILTV
jgi:GntR family transcriptional repressor for pyruvate dehydrogenase complex